MTKTKINVRIVHRYLGFFLVGVLAVYSISGISLIFRNTDTLKKTVVQEVKIEKNIEPSKLGKKLRIKGFKVDSISPGYIYFKQGTYEIETGIASYEEKKYPYVLDKMMKLHKATTDSKIYWLNIFFGLSLLFFVVSSFWMFLPQTQIFKKGVVFALLGFIFTLVILFI